MAARKKLFHTELVRNRIRVSQLMNRLQNSVLDGEKMSPEQVAAAKFLIERVIPRAEAPKDLNVKGDLSLHVSTGVPDGNAAR